MRKFDYAYELAYAESYEYTEGSSPFIHRTDTENIDISDGTFILGIISKYGTYGSYE